MNPSFANKKGTNQFKVKKQGAKERKLKVIENIVSGGPKASN